MEYHLRIPPDKRHAFSEPLDTLITGTRKETLNQVENKIENFLKQGIDLNFYIVGDIVSKDFLSNSFLKSFIKICIIDEKTQRNYISFDFEDFFEDIVEFKNPEGIIHKDCWDLFRKIIKSEKRTLVKIIEGEEDLLLLPLVLEIPLQEGVKNIAFYGQPPITDSNYVIPEGIVIVNVDKGVQEKVKTVISLMEKF